MEENMKVKIASGDLVAVLEWTYIDDKRETYCGSIEKIKTVWKGNLKITTESGKKFERTNERLVNFWGFGKTGGQARLITSPEDLAACELQAVVHQTKIAQRKAEARAEKLAEQKKREQALQEDIETCFKTAKITRNEETEVMGNYARHFDFTAEYWGREVTASCTIMEYIEDNSRWEMEDMYSLKIAGFIKTVRKDITDSERLQAFDYEVKYTDRTISPFNFDWMPELIYRLSRWAS